jgi:hypothetical protein
MSKIVDDLIEDEEREAWEYDYSIMLACQFIKDKMVPLLEDFEQNNPDENYIDGSATHALFITLVQLLGEIGFTEEELKDEVMTYFDSSIGETLH